MITSKKGLDLIRSFEKFSSNVYICPAGIRTIGYGHVLRKNEEYIKLSKLEAIKLLKLDIIKIEKAILRNIFIQLEQNQFDSLVSLVFNIGPAALQRSTLRQKINSEADENDIYNEFMKWVFVRGTKMRGLVIRRKIEANLYFS